MRTMLSERGQITIPKSVRDRLGLKGGTELEFETEGGRIIVTKAAPSTSFKAFAGVARDGRRTDDVIRDLRGGADLPDSAGK